MVKRYSHIAIVSGETDCKLEHGEYIPGSKIEFEVKGQYFQDNTGNQKRYNPDGGEIIIKGEFSTLHKKIDGVTRIMIESMGLDALIVEWTQFQTHSVIYI